ncbi:hypothetical protein ASF24_22655 [Methylobacterium sp. Leaf86]|nr:hypothetical protein ASF24_22655 [Methylobacterium sp. Leaf86]
MLDEANSIPQFYGMTIHHRPGSFNGAIILYGNASGAHDVPVLREDNYSIGRCTTPAKRVGWRLSVVGHTQASTLDGRPIGLSVIGF